MSSSRHDDVPCPDAFWLDGCSWGCGYYSGLLQGIVDRWGPQIYEKRWGGASAGALFALGVALGRPMDDFTALYRLFARKGFTFGVFQKMSIYHDEVMRHWLFASETEPIDISALNGKFFVGITSFPCGFVLKSDFDDVYDLMDTLHASMHIPWYCSYIEPVIIPDLSNGDQTLLCRDGNVTSRPESRVLSERRSKRPVAWYIDGGIARNCDVKLCCPGVTLNVSPVLQWRVTVLDCVFPMTMDRFEEVQKQSKLDVLQFTSSDHFDVRPDASPPGGDARPGASYTAEVDKCPLSRKPSVASLTLSRGGSTADLQGESVCKKSSSYNLLAGLASAVASKVKPARNRSTVLARSAQEQWWLNFTHSGAMRVVRYCVALSMWGNRVAEWIVFKHTAKLSFLAIGLLAYVRHRARKRRLRIIN
jgi:hypothetical protein